MRVVVIGAAGQTGRLVVEGLSAAGHEVTGMVRSAEQFDIVTAAGGTPVLGDVTGDVETALTGQQAVVFCAGAPLSGDPVAVDRDGCIAAQQAAREAGVRRWVQLSSLMADKPDFGPPILQGTLRAKNESDEAVTTSGLDWTVVRPGGLLNEPGTGLVGFEATGPRGLPRADVAAVLVAALDADNTIGKAFDLLAGDRPIAEAVASL